MRLKPSIDKEPNELGENVWNRPPFHQNAETLADGIHFSHDDLSSSNFEQAFENNCLIRERLPDQNERKKILNKWVKHGLDYQSWCEDSVCEPDETILYQVYFCS